MQPASIPQSGFCLIIERGQSRFPRRPITPGRFLIGAGSNCHLQLGGDIPLLHSIILSQTDTLWIDAVVPHPALHLNGRAIREGELHRGDVLEIGDFVFCVDHQSQDIAATARSTAIQAHEMTAAELLDHLSRELLELEKFETSRRRGVTSLLEAAMHLGEPRREIENEDSPRMTLRILEELRQRARELADREAALKEASQQLAASQEELRQQLHLLCESTREIAKDESVPDDESSLRKSA